MKTWRVCLIAVAAAFCGLVVSPGVTRADGLTGSTGISWIADGHDVLRRIRLPVGSSLSCPGASPICAGFSGYGGETFSVGTSSISYSVSNYPVGDYGGTTNGFDFTGLTFASGDSLTGFTIGSNTIGLTAADVTIGPSSIFINLAGLPIDGSFTIDLISGPAVSTPEPSSLVLLGIGSACAGWASLEALCGGSFRSRIGWLSNCVWRNLQGGSGRGRIYSSIWTRPDAARRSGFLRHHSCGNNSRSHKRLLAVR